MSTESECLRELREVVPRCMGADQALVFSLMAARRSPCMKSKRGACAFDGSEFASRCNRPEIGRCDGSAKCRVACGERCSHAENLALGRWLEIAGSRRCSMIHIKVDERGDPVRSGPPSCMRCATFMLSKYVARVWLWQDRGWRSWSSEDFLRDTMSTCDIEVIA